MLDLFSNLAGRRLEIDQSVLQSEQATGHRNRNRAIAYMMLNTGMIERDPIEALDLYFRQCSITISCRDLAMMAATLANDGVNPLTGVTVLDPQYVRDMLSVMNSCGMYNYAGQWSYEVGMPANGGVSDCIMAVIPGQVGIGVYSPPLDAQGNSVRGIRVCQDISNEFELHAFNNRTNVRSVIRRVYHGDRIRSSRVRTAQERDLLETEGFRIAVIEVQGALFFGSTEQLLRRIAELSETARYIVVDFKRIHLADTAACKLSLRLAPSMRESDTELMFAEIANDGPLAGISREPSEHEADRLLHVFRDVDVALEWCEEELLAEV
ncbi:MAG: glutaminase, partial [Methyloceanibacter sp.]